MRHTSTSKDRKKEKARGPGLFSPRRASVRVRPFVIADAAVFALMDAAKSLKLGELGDLQMGAWPVVQKGAQFDYLSLFDASALGFLSSAACLLTTDVVSGLKSCSEIHQYGLLAIMPSNFAATLSSATRYTASTSVAATRETFLSMGLPLRALGRCCMASNCPNKAKFPGGDRL